MAYKMIALDLDGTTVKRGNKISRENIKTIQWALKNGIKIIIATGRSINSIKKIAKKLKIIDYNLPIICFNGGIIFDLFNDKVIKQSTFKKEEVIYVFSVAERYKIKLWAYSVNYDCIAYVNTNKGLLIKWMCFNSKRKKVLFSNYDNNFNDECFKFVVSGNSENIISFKDYLLSNRKYNIFDLSYISKKSLSFEISPLNTDKKEALEYLAKIYDVEPSEVIAIGDGSNDFEMLRWAGLGIAMANAHKKIKEVADDITVHCKKSGVAKAIKKYIKIENKVIN